MIVIEVDVPKYSLSAVAVDEVGRQLSIAWRRAMPPSWSPGRSGLVGGAGGRWRTVGM